MGTMVTRNLEPEQAKEKITFKTYISYALGDTGDNIMFSTVSSLLVLFYTDYIGLSPASVALVMGDGASMDIMDQCSVFGCLCGMFYGAAGVGDNENMLHFYCIQFCKHGMLYDQ